MFCSHCGKNITDDSEFCCHCGACLNKQSIEKNIPTSEISESKAQKEKNNTHTSFCCPQCGNKDLQITTETKTHTTGSNYSAGKGCLGYLLFGPLGLLCGACGQGQRTTTTNETYWHCTKCGNKFKHPDELRKEIDLLDYEKSVFSVMCIIGAIVAFILLIIIAQADVGIALLVSFFTFGSFALIGFAVKVANDAKKEKLKEELQELRHKIEKFQNE